MVDFNQISPRISETYRNPTPGGKVPPPPSSPPLGSANAENAATSDESMNAHAIIERGLPAAYQRGPIIPYERSQFHQSANGTIHAWVLYVGDASLYKGDAVIFNLKGEDERLMRLELGPEFEEIGRRNPRGRYY